MKIVRVWKGKRELCWKKSLEKEGKEKWSWQQENQNKSSTKEDAKKCFCGRGGGASFPYRKSNIMR